MATYEEHVRAYREAKRAYDAEVRQWIPTVQAEIPRTEEAFKALEYRYAVEHEDKVAAVDALAGEMNIARAELDRRWVEAHEDLAVLHKALSPRH